MYMVRCRCLLVIRRYLWAWTGVLIIRCSLSGLRITVISVMVLLLVFTFIGRLIVIIDGGVCHCPPNWSSWGLAPAAVRSIHKVDCNVRDNHEPVVTVLPRVC